MGRYAQGVDPEAKYGHMRGKVHWALCDRCGFQWPETEITEQDGFRLCKDNCAKRWGKTDRDRYDVKQTRKLAREEARTPQPLYPFQSEMRGVPGVESISPEPPIRLTAGGAPVAITLTGVELSDEDLIEYGSDEIVDAVPPVYAVDGFTVVLSVEAEALATGGDFELSYNGNRHPNVFQVRG